MLVQHGTIKKGTANCIDHNLLKNTLLRHNVEKKIEARIRVIRRRGRTRKQLLDDLKETKGYCKLKEEAAAGTMWRTRFGRGCGPVSELIN